MIFLEAYQGYFEKGRVIPIGNPPIPDGSEVIITVLDKSARKSLIDRRLKAISEFREGLRTSDEELGPEFDEILSQRVNITRELDL